MVPKGGTSCMWWDPLDHSLVWAGKQIKIKSLIFFYYSFFNFLNAESVLFCALVIWRDGFWSLPPLNNDYIMFLKALGNVDLAHFTFIIEYVLFRPSSHSSKFEIFTRNSYSQLQVLNQSVENFSSAANSFPTISTSSFYTFSSKFREVFPILPMNRGPRYVLCIIWKNYLLIQCLFRNLTPNTRSTFYNEFKFTSISHSLGLLSSVVATLNFLTRRDSSQPTYSSHLLTGRPS